MARKITYRVGVDIGGTFTDIVLLGSDGAVHTKKISSSVEDYARAIVDGLGELFAETGVAPGAIEEIRHGTTVASNAILEQKGARVGLITTKGFRDVLEIRTLRMPRLYDMAWTKPPPLVERYLRQVVDERIDHKGRVERALDRRRRRTCGWGAAGREGRGHRRVPPQFVRQSGARADAARYRQAPRAGPALVGLLRGAAGDQGIRAHLDDRHQRLRDADRGHLSARHAPTPRRGAHPGPAPADAVERRAHDRQGRRRAAHEHHRIGPGRRRHRRAGAGARGRPRQDHHLRHGRHDSQGVDGRGRPGHARARIRRRRRHHGGIAIADGRRLHAQSSGHRPGRGRRGRRLARVDRRRRRPAGGTAERRGGPRAGVLRRRRRRADGHRREPDPRSPEPQASRRRGAQAQCREGPRQRLRPALPSRWA